MTLAYSYQSRLDLERCRLSPPPRPPACTRSIVPNNAHARARARATSVTASLPPTSTSQYLYCPLTRMAWRIQRGACRVSRERDRERESKREREVQMRKKPKGHEVCAYADALRVPDRVCGSVADRICGADRSGAVRSKVEPSPPPFLFPNFLSSFPLFDAPCGNVVHVGPCLLNVHYSTRPAGTQFPIIIPIIRRARRNVGPCLLNVHYSMRPAGMSGPAESSL